MADLISTAMTNFRDGLRTLTDPINPRTRGGDMQWIIIGHFHPNIPEKTPKVYITQKDEKPGEEFLGGGPRAYFITAQLELRVREATNGTVDDVEYKNSALLSRIQDKISNYIDTNQKTITGIEFARRLNAGVIKWDDKTKSWYVRMKYELYIHKAT